MNRKMFLGFALILIGTLSIIILLINVRAQEPQQGQIAFLSRRDNIMGEIYLMNADGTNVHRLTNHPAWERHPAWSPDGQKIAFMSNRDGMLNWEIYVMDADGKNVHRLTNHPAYDGDTEWSPDGQQIAFVTDRDGNFEIYVMDANGKNQVNLTNHPMTDVEPSWFGPAFELSVSSAGKEVTTWGWLKQSGK